MGKRGSESRRKERSVLVRLHGAEFERLSILASGAGITRAAYLRHLLKEDAGMKNGESEKGALSEGDRIQLSVLIRNAGYLAGLLKLAVIKTPAIGTGSAIGAFVEQYRQELRELQGQIRSLLERVR